MSPAKNIVNRSTIIWTKPKTALSEYAMITIKSKNEKVIKDGKRIFMR